jgi:hypothetical protein
MLIKFKKFLNKVTQEFQNLQINKSAFFRNHSFISSKIEIKLNKSKSKWIILNNEIVFQSWNIVSFQATKIKIIPKYKINHFKERNRINFSQFKMKA